MVGSACVFFFFQVIVMVIFLVVLHHAPDMAYFPVLLLALVTGIILASALWPCSCRRSHVYLRAYTQHPDREVVLTGVVLGLPDRVRLPAEHRRGQLLGPKVLTWVYFLNPMVPLVLSFPTLHSTHTRPPTPSWAGN